MRILRATLVLATMVSAPGLIALRNGSAGTSGNRGSAGRVICYVSILPQAFFVEGIGGEFVDVRVMVGPGQVPHTYEPKSRQLADLAQSRIYFTVGVEFEESLLPRIERNFKFLRVVDTCAGIRKRPMALGNDAGAVGGAPSRSVDMPSSNRSHSGNLDPHVWLSPKIAVIMCANVRDALTQIDSSHAGYFSSRFDELKSEIERADQEVARVLSPYKGREIFVYHPAFGYFTDEYGLVQVEVEEIGSITGPRHLAEVIEKARAQRARVIFVQPEVSETYARTVADAIAGRVVPLDPLAEKYTENLLTMARRIADSFGTQ